MIIEPKTEKQRKEHRHLPQVFLEEGRPDRGDVDVCVRMPSGDVWYLANISERGIHRHEGIAKNAGLTVDKDGRMATVKEYHPA